LINDSYFLLIYLKNKQICHQYLISIKSANVTTKYCNIWKESFVLDDNVPLENLVGRRDLVLHFILYSVLYTIRTYITLYREKVQELYTDSFHCLQIQFYCTDIHFVHLFAVTNVAIEFVSQGGESAVIRAFSTTRTLGERRIHFHSRSLLKRDRAETRKNKGYRRSFYSKWSKFLF